MGKPESLANVINIVESATEPILVVVSALGGITDKLILTARMAAEGDKSYLDNLANIKERHFDMVEKMVLPENKKAALEKVTDLLTQLSDIYKGLSLVNELSRHSLDGVIRWDTLFCDYKRIHKECTLSGQPLHHAHREVVFQRYRRHAAY